MAARADEVAAGLGKGSLYGAHGGKHQLFLRTFAGLTGEVRRRSTARIPRL
jgi:TetR/AcrR family transcriptional regulator, transcriptional repressor for nem operon